MLWNVTNALISLRGGDLIYLTRWAKRPSKRPLRKPGRKTKPNSLYELFNCYVKAIGIIVNYSPTFQSPLSEDVFDVLDLLAKI
jgi:hypothetical protein